MQTYRLSLKELDINTDVIKAYKAFWQSMEDETNAAALDTGNTHYLCDLGYKYIVTDTPMAEIVYTSEF